uniref:Uncharacterized protein n=1 Tax=Quercus lobata TaxID=97700 RepID=A0A7N2L7K4_QUELO
MALPIGKVVVLLGAGIVGSVLAKEGRMSTVSDFVSGAFKSLGKQGERLKAMINVLSNAMRTVSGKRKEEEKKKDEKERRKEP